MNKINSIFHIPFSYMVYGSLMILSLGLVTSTSLLALSHILIALPMLYFLHKTNFKMLSKSSWSLLAFSLILIVSVVANQDIAVKGYAPAFKVKYFLIGFLSIGPYSWWAKKYSTEKKVTYLLYAFCIATTVATLSGIGATLFGYNLLLGKSVEVGGRYGGVFGMVMNYGHNMVYFLIIIGGMLVHRKQIEKYINIRFLFLIFLINLIGFYFSYTRGAWLAFVVAFPFFFFQANKKLFMGLFIMFMVLGGLMYFTAGKNVVRSFSDNQRISQWRAAIEAFKERPILGYGYLNFENHSGEIKKKYNLGELELVSHAHNNFLEVLADSGVFGIVTYLLWLFYWLLESYKRSDVIAKISFPFILAFIVGGLTQSTISLGINLFFIMAAYSISQIKRDMIKI